MRLGYVKWFAACVLLSACVASPRSQTSHEVQVLSHDNAFLQTTEVAAWSIQTYTDEQGNLWPTGLTLSAQAVQHVDGLQRRTLILRRDEVSDIKPPFIYEHARALRRRLIQQCKTIELIQDGRSIILPVTTIIVRTLASHELMPVPATDGVPDPVELLVGQNTSDSFVLSIRTHVDVGREAWANLAFAKSLKYVTCIDTGTANEKELAALRKVISQSDLIYQGLQFQRGGS